MAAQKRVLWIDVIKFICIYFVIVSHLGSLSIAPALRLFYTPFFLSGFLFASGYTYRHKTGFQNHLKKKIFQLLIPWFCFSMLTRILAQLRSFGLSKFLTDLKWNFLQIRGMDDGMWFVAALFVAYLPFYFFIGRYESAKAKLRNKREADILRKKYLLLSLLLIFVYYLYTQFMPAALFPWGKNALPWHIEYIPYALGCMFLGYAAKEKYDKIPAVIAARPVSVVLLTAGYLVVVFLPSVLHIELPPLFDCIYNLFLCLLGILFIVCISRIVRPNTYILYVGRNTLTYFGLQGKCIFVMEGVLKKLNSQLFTNVTADPVLSVIYSLIAGLILSFVLIIPALFINRFLPFMAGKKRK